MTNRDEIHLLSGAYALDALNAEEAARIESAMADSEELRNEIVGLTDTAVALGLAVAPIAPPAALRGRLLDAIEDLPQEPPAARVDPSAPAASPVVGPVDSTRSGAHLAPRRRARRRTPAVLLIAAVTAVLLFSGGFLVQRSLLSPQVQYAQLTAAADVQQHSDDIAGGGSATVYWSDSQNRTAVVINGVTVPVGKVLQLWTVRSKTDVKSAGVFQPEGDEHYELRSGVPAGRYLAVSVESPGGSTTGHPSGVPIATVPVV